MFLAQALAAQASEGAGASIVNITSSAPASWCRVLHADEGVAGDRDRHARPSFKPARAGERGRARPALPSSRQDAEAFARQQAALPLAAGPRPEDIAAAVVYLATASAVTGETLAVDGGQHVAWQTPDAFGFAE